MGTVARSGAQRSPSVFWSGIALMALIAVPGITLAQAPQYVSSVGGPGSGLGQLYYPQGVAVDEAGNLYVADTDHQMIQVFNASGQYVRSWGAPGIGPGRFNSPYGVAVARDGRVFVADLGNNRIQVFSPSGDYLLEWGAYGTGPDQMKSPRAVAVDATGNVYVAEGGRVHKFTSAGLSLAIWGGNGREAIGGTYGIAFDPAGDVYVARQGGQGGVWKFSPDGGFLLEWVGRTTSLGAFSGHPGGIAIDPHGRVFLTDYLNHRIQYFSPDGEYLGEWGGLGTGTGQFHYASGITVLMNGDVAVSDQLNSRVQVFSFANPTNAPASTFGALKARYR